MNNIRPYLRITPIIAEHVMIDPTAVVIGDVDLGTDVSIWPHAVVRGDVNYILIGAQTNIQDGSVLHVTHKSAEIPEGYPLVIGEQVTIGHNAVLHGCRIGDRVLIGMGAIILDGAVIENDVMIGAGSVVPPNKHLKSGWLYFGSPVKPIRSLSKEEKHALRKSAENYVELKNHYR